MRDRVRSERRKERRRKKEGKLPKVKEASTKRISLLLGVCLQLKYKMIYIGWKRVLIFNAFVVSLCVVCGVYEYLNNIAQRK